MCAHLKVGTSFPFMFVQGLNNVCLTVVESVNLLKAAYVCRGMCCVANSIERQPYDTFPVLS